MNKNTDFGSASVASDSQTSLLCRPTDGSPNSTMRQATPKQWENLANEAIADSGYWKREARAAQGQRDLLLRSTRLAQSVIGGADTSGAGQRAAHAALFVALANCEASNLESEAV